MTDERPDDRSGDGFLRTLQALRGRHAPQARSPSPPVPPIRWDVRAGGSDGDAEWEATASFEEFVLVAVEMREVFLTGKPGFLPKVSWCLSHCPGSGDIQVGGPAPTLEDAKARAEVALRVWIGAAMDS